MMQAIEIKKNLNSNKNELSLCKRPTPTPNQDEVLIKVKAAGINRPDLLQVAGHYPPPKGITDIPGLEVAGIIEKGNDDWRVGDEVCALLAGGGYAEYAICPSEQILKKPKGWSFEQAAGLPETLFTVWSNLAPFYLSPSKKHLLVHGGSSGIGHISIQLGKYFNKSIATTASTAEKLSFCENLGAQITINYKDQDFEDEINKVWGASSLDYILDMVGGSYIEKHTRLLAKYGTHITIALLGGRSAKFDLRDVLTKNLTFKGTTLRPKTHHEKGQIRDDIIDKLSIALDNKEIIPHIYKTLPLSEASKAHDLLKSSSHCGKVILSL